MKNNAISAEKTCSKVGQFCQPGASDGHWKNENEALCKAHGIIEKTSWAVKANLIVTDLLNKYIIDLILLL